MLKILRITSLLAAGLAVVLIAGTAFSGPQSDEKSEQFLSSPSVVERFKQAKGNKKQADKSQISPLVEQAQAFALYLNPPPKPKPPSRQKTAKKLGGKAIPTIPSPKRPISVKFDLIGTCYFATRPEKSLALINQPGKGLWWVRQAGKVGHLVVEEVKDGLIVIRDGERTVEKPVMARPAVRKNLLKTEGSTEPPVSLEAVTVPVSTFVSTPAPVEPETDSGIAPPQSSEEAAFMEERIRQFQALQESGVSEEENAAMMEKFISDYKAMRITPAEADKLDQLGQTLEDGNQPSNQGRNAKSEKITTKRRKPLSPRERRSRRRRK